MCTAVTYRTKDRYFGRNLDLEVSLGETVTVTPRGFPLSFWNGVALKRHYAMIGVACVREGYPLYYDAVNEKGLCMAGLNFPESAVYQAVSPAADNIAPYELIPWILSQCEGVEEAVGLLERMQVVWADFSPELPATPLHWIITDGERAIAAEPMADGLRVYEDSVGVLTNEPPFPVQMAMLRNYANLTAKEPVSRFADGTELKPYSRGMGAMGLPGDLSSASRFVRAAFTKCNAVSGETEEESVGQVFHILDAVAQSRGCCRLEEGKYEITVYSACCNADRGIYYYTTYENRQITAVDLHRENLDGETLLSYPMHTKQQFRLQNGT